MTQTAVSRRAFRDAMARLPAAVNILTTDGPYGRCGITVSAVCSVTDTPPTVLVCVNRSSSSHPVFVGNGRVCLNVLTGRGAQLAVHFSGATKTPMDDRFAWDIWDRTAEQPVLREAQVAAVGTICDRKEIGSHTVLFVQIEHMTTRAEVDSLVYVNRQFHRILGHS
ncbi:flavin reductase [Amycolatopsis jejuensis]|uniref:flavin reductase n=1 Tax=Amycolatopsis jejuensis TaxID=330084 RepID=UPI0005276407|nr:flavin reductase [Amycolatopsis jejuensis]